MLSKMVMRCCVAVSGLVFGGFRVFAWDGAEEPRPIQ